ncbi:hypothetical protein IWT140_00162 [Secundilactobacillus pentosiphilus]|uniref:RES domain-containing protein n=1 Tax=Secundilactobacillus pentosiphilus TaxID=1714682 RepID=A0A1Z5ILD0_9LACO|nr:hypothetical protein [Secundilactobacillus pentosiphilus]GAX02565.1 hypothetical protein IWT140_00162 [Secundilactobacillus pentosiphilus]
MDVVKILKRHFIDHIEHAPGYTKQTVEEAERNVQSIMDGLETVRSEQDMEDLLGQYQVSYPSGGQSWNQDSFLFRARVMDCKCWRDAGYWGRTDFWETPAELVRSYGRLNRPHESILYLANKFQQTFREIRYQKKSISENPVVVTKYRVKRPFHSLQIGYVNDNPLTELDRVNNVYAKMLRTIFSFPAETMGERVYKMSNKIAQYYPYLPNEARCRSFSAVSNPNALNLAFDPSDEHNFLDYAGSLIVPNYKESLDGNISAEVCLTEDFKMISPDENLDWIVDNFGIGFPDPSDEVI